MVLEKEKIPTPELKLTHNEFLSQDFKPQNQELYNPIHYLNGVKF